MPASQRSVLLAALLCAGLAGPALAEGYLTAGVPIDIRPERVRLIVKGIIFDVPLPRNVQVFVSQRIPIGDAQPGDTVAATGVKVKEAGKPSLEASETYLVHQPVPDAARKALALRFLAPLPKEDPLGIGFATWSGIVSGTVDGGVEFRRGDGTSVVARPNSDEMVGQLRPGTRADLPAGRLVLFGVGEKVTAIVVDVRQP